MPELLAPAGDWDCVRAAIENGADAVYFGLDCGFNARARAKNFPLEDLPALMVYLHRRGVKGYAALNILVYPGELPEVERVIRMVAAAGVDAVLVQDLGIVRLVRATCPDLSIHASTQMTLTSAECIEAAAMLGIQRVVLARELSIGEIAKIHHQTSVPLEAFVHGALCVAYSGQCLTSESLGGRSANRGQCAQACRLPFEVVCDGADIDLDKIRYLLSPQDLAAFALVPDLLAAGVSSLKIEGRLKSPEYVANITRHYRRAVDAAAADRPVSFSQRDIREMELSFSRGFSPGWLQGCDHKMLVPGLSSAKRGVFLGQIKSIRGPRVEIQLAGPVAPGDGVVFEGDRSRGEEQGGRVFEVFRKGRPVTEPVSSGRVDLAFDRTAIDTSRLNPGQSIWKTDDPRLTRSLRKTFSGADAVRRVPLDLTVQAVVGQRLRIDACAASGATCSIESDEPLAAAVKHPVTEDLLRKQLGRLGGTVYQLRGLNVRIDGAPMVPLSVLGRLRHEMTRQLDDSVEKRTSLRVSEDSALNSLRTTIPHTLGTAEDTHSEPRLRVLCRSLEQLLAVLESGIESVMVDFQDIRNYRQAVEVARQRGAEVYLATPRIQKPDELGLFRALLRQQADGILVRNLAGLQFFDQRDMPLVADFSLNAANELTVQLLHEQGAKRVTASYDLNRDQLLDLVSATPPSWLEVVIHQHMPMFHMEHCVFCAVLSPGTDKTDCGRPCDVHDVKLRDRIGMEHPLKADVGCRNTLFNAIPQSSAEIVPRLLKKGIRDFRVELLDDSPDQVPRIVDLYRSLLANRVTGKEIWKRLRASNRVGVTRGTLEQRRDPLAII